MAIKLKSSKAWGRLTNGWVKAVAFILVCVLMGINCCIMIYLVQSDAFYDWKERPKYIDSTEYRQKSMDMYERLCIYSAFYLRQQDKSGNFVGDKDFCEQFEYYLDYNFYKYQNDNDNIHLVSDDFNYYVSYKEDDGQIHYDTNVDFDYLDDDCDEKEKLYYLTKNYSNYIFRGENDIRTDKTLSEKSVRYDYFKAASTVANEPSDETSCVEYYANNLVPMGTWYYNDEDMIFYYGNLDPIVISKDDDESYYNDDSYADKKFIKGKDNNITVFFAPKENAFKTAQAAYDKSIQGFRYAYYSIIGLSVIAVLLTVYLMIVCGCKVDEEGNAVRFKWGFLGRIPTGVYIILAGFCLMFALGMAAISVVDENMDADTRAVQNFISNRAVQFLWYTSLYCLGFGSLMELIIKIKNKSFLSDCLVVKILRKVIFAYHNSSYYKSVCQRPIGTKLILRLIKTVSALMLLFILFILEYDSGISVLALIIGAAVSLLYVIVSIKDFISLNALSNRISNLGSDNSTQLKPKSIAYNDSKKLTEISDKVKEAVDEQIKSEKMKIELVANVSHDLKTPLTSIISYIDLLKKMELDDEAASYVKIIDRKSQKLKNIVQDVFSLAKATSGIDVNITKFDFVMMFNQVIADCDDKIRQSGKEVVVSGGEQSVLVMADSDKMYRVFQNLIDNALNYAMDNTRIFAEVYIDGSSVMFAMKNISAEPINFTVDEITERFVRGDKSRTDGGSGLGLSIAKSFTEACGGEFTVELDGDMFKTFVKLPIYKEEEVEDIQEE